MQTWWGTLKPPNIDVSMKGEGLELEFKCSVKGLYIVGRIRREIDNTRQ